MKTISETVLGRANELLTASKSLDYKGIVKNDKAAVSQLNEVLQQLDIKPKNANDELDQYASKQNAGSTSAGDQSFASDQSGSLGADDTAALSRQQQIAATLSTEGLDSRLGKVYNSASSDRVLDFSHVPHQRGLPPFDFVLAADYAPVAGLHGIFITADEVMSIILPSDVGLDADWETLKSRSYTSQDELTEYVTLLSAGFELP